MPKEKGDVSQAKIAFKDADVIVIPAGIPRTYCDAALHWLGLSILTCAHREARHDP